MCHTLFNLRVTHFQFIDYLKLFNCPVSVFLTFLGTGFFSDKRKACRRQAETTDNKYQADQMSTDDPNSKPTHPKH